MKKIKITYWIVTGIFAAFMLFSAIPDILVVPDAVTMITGLGYPRYIIPFLCSARNKIYEIGLMVQVYFNAKDLINITSEVMELDKRLVKPGDMNATK